MSSEYSVENQQETNNRRNPIFEIRRHADATRYLQLGSPNVLMSAYTETFNGDFVAVPTPTD